MTKALPDSLWKALQTGNPWWPSLIPARDDMLSWRHSLAILMRHIDPEPIFAALPSLFETLYEQASDEVCARLGGTDSPSLAAAWYEVWMEHFDSWNDPVRQLVEQHCATSDGLALSDMLTRMSGYAFCDFVLEAYEHQMFLRRIWGQADPDATLPLASVDLTRRPFVKLASNYSRRFCAERCETAAMPDDPLGGLEWNRIGGATLLAGDGQ